MFETGEKWIRTTAVVFIVAFVFAISLLLIGCGGKLDTSETQQKDESAASEKAAVVDHAAEIEALADYIPKEAKQCAEKRLEKLPEQFAKTKRYADVSGDLFYATPYVKCVPGAVHYAEYCFPVVDNKTGSVVSVVRVFWGEDGCDSVIDWRFVKTLNKVDYADSPSLFYLGTDPSGEDITLVADDGVTFTELRGSADDEMKEFEAKPFEERLAAVRDYIKNMIREPTVDGGEQS